MKPLPPESPHPTGQACTHDDLEDFLRQLEIPDDGDFNTEEEVRLSTPHSNTRAWIRMLRVEVVKMEHRLTGPPGLRARIERKYGSMSILEYMSRSHRL
jgi:hypothetical protein